MCYGHVDVDVAVDVDVDVDVYVDVDVDVDGAAATGSSAHRRNLDQNRDTCRGRHSRSLLSSGGGHQRTFSATGISGN